MHGTNHGTAHCCYGALQLESYLLPVSEVLSIGTFSQASFNLLKNSIVFLHGVNRSCKSNFLVINRLSGVYSTEREPSHLQTEMKCSNPGLQTVGRTGSKGERSLTLLLE